MNLELASEDIIKLLLAILIGGVIGAEREYRDKAAGFRTMIFICVGSTLFTMFSLKLARSTTDPERIAAQIVTGVGFLGAGTILRGAGGQVVGLTTAATIWLVAALGMGIGGEQYGVSLAGAVFTLIVLWLFPHLEHWIDNRRHTVVYEIFSLAGPGHHEELMGLFREHGLKAFERKRGKVGEHMITTWEVHGTPHDHAQLCERLFTHPDVREFHV